MNPPRDDRALMVAEPGRAARPAPAATAGAAPQWLLMVGLVLVSLNLRPALSSVSPLLGALRHEFALSDGIAGLLAAAPVFCLGLFGPLAPVLARRIGTEVTILGALLVIVAGLLLRTGPSVATLFAGTLLAGAGIGVAGVLLPGIVKRDFAHRAGPMTGLYSMALCLGAATAAGATVPLAGLAGGAWRPALGFWAAPALVAAVIWLPQLRRGGRARTGRPIAPGRSLWRDPLAWQVTLFMGLQSCLAYIVFGWLPPILVARGLDAGSAGLALSVSVMSQALAALVAPTVAGRARSQSLHAVASMVLVLAGLMGAILAPLGGLWIWMVVLGVGQGAVFAVALVLLVLRAGDAHDAARLSGMAQSVGYTLAGAGPLAVGLVHQWTGSWSAVALMLLAIGLVATVAGAGAGRPLMIGRN